jgi:glycine/D-amino acid oxidase-like deaminating enzyme
MDLRSGTPFWAVQTGSLGVYPPLTVDVDCDVAVVGGGITGALVAHRLSLDGHRCVVVDKRDIGWGSTMASTALLQYEIDVPLRVLAAKIGVEDATAAYRLCVTAVDLIDRLTAGLGDRCGFERCQSLFLANSPEEIEDFEHERDLRRAAGIDVQLLSAVDVRSRYGIERPAAMLSVVAAVVEPFRLTHRLLADSVGRGASVFDRTAVTLFEPVGDGWRILTDRGPQVRAKRLVFATGYESASMLKQKVVRLRSTFALATEPVAPNHFPAWLAGHVVWESGAPYFYMRSGPDRRLLMGGEDSPFKSAATNQRVLSRRTDNILAAFGSLLPRVPLEVAYTWAGVFGETADGLGYFGESPEFPGVDFVLGFGGNGITFSALMAEMLAHKYRTGRDADGARLFGFGR